MGWGEAAQEALEADPQYQKLLKAFRLFDKDGNGDLDAKELRDLLCRSSGDTQALTVEDAAQIIADFDENGDGKLSIEELATAWTIIGGGNSDLEAAMEEKRAMIKQEKAAAIKKKQEAGAAAAQAEKKAALEPQRPLTSGKSQAQMAKIEAKAAEAAVAAADAERQSIADGTYSGGHVSEYLPDEEDTRMSAAERARASAAAKVGKAVPTAGKGTLSADKKPAPSAPEKPLEEMTAAERAKAKAKADLEAKEARKKAAKEAKKKAEADAAAAGQ